MAGLSTRVCISTPTKGEMRAEVVTWLLQTFVGMAPNVEWLPVIDSRPLDHLRNLQVRSFLAGRCSHLFFLDSHCVPRPATVQRLLAHELPIVQAPGLQKIGNEVGVMAVDQTPEGYIQHRPMEGLQQVDAVGTAGLLVRRDVFENIPPPWFRFEYSDEGLLTRGEDFAFCDKAKRHGHEIWSDFELVQPQHFKAVAIR